MIIVGFVLFVLAVAAAITLIGQNRGPIADVHVLGYVWQIHLYSVLAAGMAIGIVGILGLAAMKTGARRAAVRRRDRGEPVTAPQTPRQQAQVPIQQMPGGVVPPGRL